LTFITNLIIFLENKQEIIFLMKKGKTSKILGFKTAKITYGTVDSFELKSLYLNIQTWVEPKKESDNWNRVVLNLSRAIKHTIYNNLDNNIFKEHYIVDLDLRSSGIQLGKKSFLNLEINFFILENNLDFKDTKLKDTLKLLTKNIINQNLSKNEYFNFTLTKKNKPSEV
jgi:hypothetical protein